jgi:hypothetical protein
VQGERRVVRSGRPRGTGASGSQPLLPLLLVPIALLPNLAAALPLATYYLGELSTVFLPLRLLAARELGAGRLLLWNPYVFEGSFELPALYPPDLLHALWPNPAFVSWLLTLHLPLGALAACWLARELRVSRAGAFLAGSIYALCGFSLSCLGHYGLLQALALAPFVAGLLRRAANEGGRAVALAGLLLALALTTNAFAFVAQAWLAGAALGLVEAPGRAALERLALATALGIGIAGLPLVLGAALLPEATLGTALASPFGLRETLHPAALAQAFLPGVPGAQHFTSLYVGPLVLALAAIGVLAQPSRLRLVLLGLAGLGMWLALGTAGLGLLLPLLALTLAAGFAADRLLAGRDWMALAAAAGALAALAVAAAVTLSTSPAGLVAWAGLAESAIPQLTTAARRDAGVVLLLALGVAAAAWAVERGALTAARGLALVVALCVGDLARAGWGQNPQEQPSFFDALPEVAALRLSALDGGRVFSYGLDHSPAFRELSARGGPALELTSRFLRRQILAPYANVLDRVEAPEGMAPAALLPRPHERGRELYDTARLGELLPWLRNSGVARVLSLDPLSHPELVPLASIPAGPTGMAIHAYAFESWPRASLACRATPVASREQALEVPSRKGFDPWREVALEEQGGGPDDALPATCTKGRAKHTWSIPGEEHYEVSTNASAYLVVRASHASGWQAHVDGVPAPVLRANGKHRAVAVSAGRHEVVLRYAPPGFVPGLALSVVSLLVALLLLASGVRRGRR